MSTYKRTEDDGTILRIRKGAAADQVWMSVASAQGDFVGTYLRNADVPAVALELLKVAGQESVIVPKSKREIEDFGHGNLRCGLTDVGFTSSSEWARDRAAELLALAEYRDAAAAREAAKKAEAEAAEKKLQERRDALAARFTGNKGAEYGQCLYATKQAIDAYITLEDGASRD